MLSKSKVVRGMQCAKSLWMYTHQYKLQDPLTASQQALFKRGNQVGELAQDLWPGGVDASAGQPYPNKICAQKTAELLSQGLEIIYEATFIFHDTLVALDVLVKEDGVWNAYEVKSSSSVKGVNYKDAAIQYYVINGAGIELNSISIVHINSQYERQGALDLNQLFAKKDITDEVLELQDNVRATIEELQELVQQKSAPEVEIGPHCTYPYGCSFRGTCWKGIPEYSVFNINNIRDKAWKLYAQGITEIKDVPEGFKLNETQSRQVACEKSGEAFVRPEAVKSFLASLEYPIYFLDFETINPAVPPFDGVRPFAQIAFQYSLHIQEEKGGPIIHKEFLANADGDDFRKGLIQQLIADCGTSGTVLAYYQAFEMGRIQEFSKQFPEYATALESIHSRIKDLIIPFKNQDYYTPEMMGKSSIKNVLPALVPELSYANLKIGDGLTASNTFLNYMNTDAYADLPKLTRDNLLEYCKMDTWAMVKLLEALEEV